MFQYFSLCFPPNSFPPQFFSPQSQGIVTQATSILKTAVPCDCDVLRVSLQFADKPTTSKIRIEVYDAVDFDLSAAVCEEEEEEEEKKATNSPSKTNIFQFGAPQSNLKDDPITFTFGAPPAAPAASAAPAAPAAPLAAPLGQKKEEVAQTWILRSSNEAGWRVRNFSLLWTIFFLLLNDL